MWMETSWAGSETWASWVGGGVAAPAFDPGSTRVALVITPEVAHPRVSLKPWLWSRYRVRQIQRLTLSRSEWAALTAEDPARHVLAGVRRRLAGALLCEPDLLLVLGYPVRRRSSVEALNLGREVRQGVRHVSAWAGGTEVAGAWLNTDADADRALVRLDAPPVRDPHPHVFLDFDALLPDAAV